MQQRRILEEQKMALPERTAALAQWLAAHPWRLPHWQLFLLRVVQGDQRGLLAWLAAWILRLLSLIYGAGLALNLLPYRLWPALAFRLPARVFSIGNLTVGGTGKTSAAAALAQALSRSGERVALLSRGYSGQLAGVVSDGRRVMMSASQAGDEPFLLAHRLPGVAVLVGKDRRITGRVATRFLRATALVLDDGSQYWKMHKDLELVLVDALNPFGFGRLLPSGLLREPIGSIKRARQIWLTHCDLVPTSHMERLEKTVRRLSPGAQIIRTRHKPTSLAEIGGRPVALESLDGRPLIALSSIGSPEAFERTLMRLGAKPMAMRFRDHHRYSTHDVELIGSIAARLGRAVVTTEKDAVRLPPSGWRVPCLVLCVEISAMNGEQLPWPAQQP